MTAVTTEDDEADVMTTGTGERPSRAAARRAARVEMPGYRAAAELAESGALNGLFAQIDAGEIDLTGDGGLGVSNGLCKRSVLKEDEDDRCDH